MAQQRQQLAQDRLNFEKQKYADQQNAARARQQATEKRGPSPSTTRPKPNQKAPNQNAPGAGKGGKGGKGGGGGGGGGKKSPEQQAREKARHDRQMSREADRNSRKKQNEAAKAAGYKDADDQDRAFARRDFFETGKTSADQTKSREEQDRWDKNKKALETDRQRVESERERRRKENESKGEKEKGKDRQKMGGFGEDYYDQTYNEDGSFKKTPRMVHAYGNKYAGMVKARGDLA